ncbi:hypothetical protein HAX54_036149, partial [Datura stramonium]|nr:hypothetical protein [Datura stramonium]
MEKWRGIWSGLTVLCRKCWRQRCGRVSVSGWQRLWCCEGDGLVVAGLNSEKRGKKNDNAVFRWCSHAGTATVVHWTMGKKRGATDEDYVKRTDEIKSYINRSNCGSSGGSWVGKM